MNTLRRTIEIDFDVHQAIEAERHGFDEPPNSALRRLLKLGSPAGSSPPLAGPASANVDSWTKKGVTLPEGTELQVKYAEIEARGRVIGGKLNFDGEEFSAPSRAVMTVIERTRGNTVNINGWIHVHAKPPGEESWISLARLRDRAVSNQS